MTKALSTLLSVFLFSTIVQAQTKAPAVPALPPQKTSAQIAEFRKEQLKLEVAHLEETKKAHLNFVTEEYASRIAHTKEMKALTNKQVAKNPEEQKAFNEQNETKQKAFEESRRNASENFFKVTLQKKQEAFNAKIQKMNESFWGPGPAPAPATK